MQALICFRDKQYKADFSAPIDISIPLTTEGEAVNAFFAPRFEVAPVVTNSFTGSVEKGGAVNFQNMKLNPHGNGTHTECVGHIMAEKVTINQCLRNFFFIAEVISLFPMKQENGDEIILRGPIENKLSGKECDALIIRTLPNDSFKLKKNYSGKNPAYLHHHAAEFLAGIGVKHLLVDLPSVDREEDEGKLLSHKRFWRYPEDIRKDATITELVFVPDAAADGTYLLNLQIASFELDASPSKPVLYALTRQ